MEKVTIDNVCYELNAKNRTAVIVKGKCEGNIVIPDNITHRDIVYIIKGVGESAFIILAQSLLKLRIQKCR